MWRKLALKAQSHALTLGLLGDFPEKNFSVNVVQRLSPWQRWGNSTSASSWPIDSRIKAAPKSKRSNLTIFTLSSVHRLNFSIVWQCWSEHTWDLIIDWKSANRERQLMLKYFALSWPTLASVVIPNTRIRLVYQEKKTGWICSVLRLLCTGVTKKKHRKRLSRYRLQMQAWKLLPLETYQNWKFQIRSKNEIVFYPDQFFPCSSFFPPSEHRKFENFELWKNQKLWLRSSKHDSDSVFSSANFLSESKFQR